jgi:hypothetical protein
MSSSTPFRSYPKPLGDWVVHAMRLANFLDAMTQEASPSDPSYLWILGRSEEVRVYVREVVRDWHAGKVSATSASGAIGVYVAQLHAGLRSWRGSSYIPPCCAGSVPPPALAASKDNEHETPPLPAANERSPSDVTPSEVTAPG